MYYVTSVGDMPASYNLLDEDRVAAIYDGKLQCTCLRTKRKSINNSNNAEGDNFIRTFFDKEPAVQEKWIDNFIEQYPYILVGREIYYNFHPADYNRTTREHILLAFEHNKHPADVYTL